MGNRLAGPNRGVSRASVTTDDRYKIDFYTCRQRLLHAAVSRWLEVTLRATVPGCCSRGFRRCAPSSTYPCLSRSDLALLPVVLLCASPPSLVVASFGNAWLKVYLVGSETLATTSTPPLAPCAARRSRGHTAACVPWCSSLRAWRCIVLSTSEVVKGPTDGRASWTRLLSLASTLSPHRLLPGILKILPLMVHVVYLLWSVIQLPCSCFFSILGPSTGSVCGQL